MKGVQRKERKRKVEFNEAMGIRRISVHGVSGVRARSNRERPRVARICL